jgi:putative spermidine/putrescine transport system permease protein
MLSSGVDRSTVLRHDAEHMVAASLPRPSVSRPAVSGPSPIAWLIAPAALLFVLFFVLPFGVMALMSVFSGNPVTNPNAVLTTRHYERFVFDTAGIYHDALWATLRIGLVTTLVSLLIGYPLAH